MRHKQLESAEESLADGRLIPDIILIASLKRRGARKIICPVLPPYDVLVGERMHQEQPATGAARDAALLLSAEKPQIVGAAQVADAGFHGDSIPKRRRLTGLGVLPAHVQMLFLGVGRVEKRLPERLK